MYQTLFLKIRLTSRRVDENKVLVNFESCLTNFNKSCHIVLAMKSSGKHLRYYREDSSTKVEISLTSNMKASKIFKFV